MLRHSAVTTALDATNGGVMSVSQFSRRSSVQTVTALRPRPRKRRSNGSERLVSYRSTSAWQVPLSSGRCGVVWSVVVR